MFHAIVIQVPLLDMLRYHLLLAGASWVAEYGDPDRSGDAEFLRQISPYHNLRPGLPYPEPLFVTSTKDDRVHPGHARKMAAKMAAMGLPFLYYEKIEGGHAAAATMHQRARRHAIEFAYLTRKLWIDGPAAQPLRFPGNARILLCWKRLGDSIGPDLQGTGMSVLAIGQRVRRDEDFRLLTGRGRYVEDVPAIGANGEPPGRGYVVRSPHAHARIVSIDAARSRAAPGVLAVLTGAELAGRGLGTSRPLIPRRKKNGAPAYVCPLPLLAQERVRYVGEPVAFMSRKR